MQNRIIEWFQEDQFASANLSRVDLFEMKAKRSLALKSSFELPSQVSCISCNASRGVIAVGQQSGNISSLNTESASTVRNRSKQCKECKECKEMVYFSLLQSRADQPYLPEAVAPSLSFFAFINT